jgi:flagellar basal body-associated protein FliL
MKKKILFILLILLSSFLFSQSKKLDYYSIGYNDGYNNKKFDSKFSTEKLPDSLKKIADEDDKIQFIQDVQSYNLGYIDGICEKQGFDSENYNSYIYEYLHELIIQNFASSYKPNVSAEEYQGQRELYDWYKNIGVIQTTTYDTKPATVRVNVYFGYKKDDKATATEITQRSVEIKDFLRRYFRGKSAEELKNPNNSEKLKMEIRNGINDKVLSSTKIRDIDFEQLDVIEQ